MPILVGSGVRMAGGHTMFFGLGAGPHFDMELEPAAGGGSERMCRDKAAPASAQAGSESAGAAPRGGGPGPEQPHLALSSRGLGLPQHLSGQRGTLSWALGGVVCPARRRGLWLRAASEVSKSPGRAAPPSTRPSHEHGLGPRHPSVP